MAKLSGVVIVSGAASGLGRESAIHFADCGATVVAVDIDESGLRSIASDRIHPLVADVTKGTECRSVAERAAALGRVAGLLNSAGIELHGSVVEMPEDDWDRVINVNLKAIFLLSKHVIPHMIAGGGGSVVNMSSVQALATQAGVAAYAATKGAVLSMTRAMALDHGKENIRVTAICPGTIETPLAHANARHWNPADPAAVLAEWGSKHALNRIGQPIDAGFANTSVSVMVDGTMRVLPPGAPLHLRPGESVTVACNVWHRFYGESGKGPVFVGEVSQVNDDYTDNYFIEKLGRFAGIEEDEPKCFPLWNELSQFFD